MLRKSELTGDLIFFAEARANRPRGHETDAASCPFCPANRHSTPADLYTSPDGRIRIFRNLYPFFDEIVSGENGFHHVMVDTDLHKQRMFAFSARQTADALAALRNHCIRLNQNKHIVYTQVFKNDGIRAGASQSHSHWQIAALSALPPRILRMAQNAKDYYERTGSCYICKLAFAERLIEENERFVAFSPFYAKFAFEINLVPKRHVHSFDALDEEDLLALGTLLKRMLQKLAALTNNGDYNICLYSAPKADVETYFHFYLQIIPRLGNMAGFEFATGSFINSVLPERAAAILRGIEV